jgi:hypothetical protein
MHMLSTLLILLCSTATVALQNRPEELAIQRVVDVVHSHEPDWRYIGGICTCPPLFEAQVGISIGTFERNQRSRHRERVELEVVAASSPDAASQWIRRFGNGGAAEGWTTEPYQLGDEAYLSTLRDGSAVGIVFRRGALLFKVDGSSLRTVARFAQYADASSNDS